jgi:hypothetical protein
LAEPELDHFDTIAESFDVRDLAVKISTRHPYAEVDALSGGNRHSISDKRG